jgi:L-fuconolactonase
MSASPGRPRGPRSPVVDAHQHFWTYDPREYDWIGDDLAAIRRDFLPEDLAREIQAAGVDAVVSVQARQTLEETRWLLDLAERNDFVAGVVGWVPLASASVADTLAELAASPKLRGVRHVLQGEPDPDYAARPDFDRGIASLHGFGLAYDVLVYERQLPAAIALVDRHPDQVFVVDHAAKPRIRDAVLSPWRERMRELARRPNVFCKLSGMATEADLRGWTRASLEPYADVVLEAFGPARSMFGSDWPVCLAACPYSRWLATVRELCGRLSAAEQEMVLGGTARRAYRLDVPSAAGAISGTGGER